MSDDDSAEKTLGGAHTRGEKSEIEKESKPEIGGDAADPESDLGGDGGGIEEREPAGDGGRADPLADAVARIAGLLEQGKGEQLDLLAGSLDMGDEDVLAQAANTVAEPRRARGRPAGSQNRRNANAFDYLEALGHRDPLVTLSMIQTADTKALGRALGMKNKDVLQAQVTAASKMLPYKYARRPQAIEVTKNERHLFVAGDLHSLGNRADDRPPFLPAKTLENQAVDDDD